MIALLAVALCSACAYFGNEGDTSPPVTFEVIDVGQGLSQLVVCNDSAVWFDLGPPEAAASIRQRYQEIGRPYIWAIAISHDHLDHYGGLQAIDPSFNWSGRIVLSPYGDTGLLRKALTAWQGPVTYSRYAQGDTLVPFATVVLRCLWPPAGLDSAVTAPEPAQNRYSAVFQVVSKKTSALITADIDSVSCRELSMRFGHDLSSDVLVVPHHGSASSLSPLFYGYVSPGLAVISCSRDNSFDHPSPQVLLWLTQAGIVPLYTYIDGTISLRSNSYYWQ